jgi:undecaprenyl-diphosphatase
MNAIQTENLILAGIALLLAASGTGAWWLAAHPAKVRAFLGRMRNHPALTGAENRYRHQIEFLVRRFQPEGAFGLSFTLGLVVLGLSTWIFGSVLRDVLAQEELALFDVPVLRYIATHRVGWLTTGMQWITYLGSGKFLLAVVIAVGLARLPQVKEVLK